MVRYRMKLHRSQTLNGKHKRRYYAELTNPIPARELNLNTNAPNVFGRRPTDKMSHFLIASSVASTVSVGTGFLLNTFVFPKFGPGPSIVMVAALLFGLCLSKDVRRIGV